MQYAINELNYDINNVGNGIGLPSTVSKALETGELLHKGPHKDYSRLVERDLAVLDRDFLAGKIDSKTLVPRIESIQQKYRTLIENQAVQLSKKDPNF